MVFRRSLLLCALVLSTAACKRGGDELTVGAFLSLSGADSTFGVDTRDAIQLAVLETNGRGGIKGKPVRVLYEDDRSSSAEATSKVRRLIDHDKVVALLGEVASSRTLAGALVANERKVPLVTPSSTENSITAGRPWVFRTCFNNTQQGTAAARFVVETQGKRKVGLLFAAQAPYATGLSQAFREALAAAGGSIVLEKPFPKGETNFTTYLEALRGAGAEAVFAPVYYNEMVLIGRQAKAVGVPGSAFVGGDGWDSANLLEGAAAELEGAHFATHYAPDVPWEHARAFITAFRERYGREPTGLAAQGYDGARVLFDALARAADTSPEAVRIALGETKGFAGATGTITLDEERNARKPVVMVRVEGGRFRYARELEVR